MTEDFIKYKCKFCKKNFLSERIYMKHLCTQMSRSKEIQTIEGRMAYEYYKIWMSKQKRTAPPPETFVTASYYTAFTRFAEWVRMTGIPTPDRYIDMMVQSKISPINWRRSEAYEIYNEFMDKHALPLDQAIVTVETLVSLSEQFECEIGDVLNHLKMAQVLELIHQRRLSMWLLWCSKRFVGWYATLDVHEKEQFRQSVNSVWWSVKLERSTDIPALKKLAEDIGI